MLAKENLLHSMYPNKSAQLPADTLLTSLLAELTATPVTPVKPKLLHTSLLQHQIVCVCATVLVGRSLLV